MPFTFSHPAAVVGLGWTRLSMTGMVAGSLAPDLPLFALAPWSYATSHSVPGVVGVDLVAGTLICALWLWVLREPALDLAPAWARSRVAGLRALDLSRSWLLVPSVVLGSLTHVAWDEFTHQGRWGSRHISWLAQHHAGLAGFRWAQYLSGLVGAVIVVASWWRYVTRRPLPQHSVHASRADRLLFRLALGISVGATATIALAVHRDDGLHAALYAAIGDAGPFIAVAVLATAFAWHGRRLAAERQQTG